MQLLLGQYLRDAFRTLRLSCTTHLPEAKAYTVNVYLAPGARAARLLRHSFDDAQKLENVVELMYINKTMELSTEKAPRVPKRKAK